MIKITPNYKAIGCCTKYGQSRYNYSIRYSLNCSQNLGNKLWRIRYHDQPRATIQVRNFTGSRWVNISSAAGSTTAGTKSGDSKSKKTKSKPKISLARRLSLAASFSFYSALVIGGIGLSGLVVYYFVSDILLPTSDVQVFKRAFSIIQKDPQAQLILGSSKLSAYGEASDNKWARSRPIASRRGFDRTGREHLVMQFHVKGQIEGLVRLEMIKSDERNHAGIGKFDFRYLLLEVPGHKRYYLIDNSAKPKPTDKQVGFLGVKWGKS